jgi:hypothetical protein
MNGHWALNILCFCLKKTHPFYNNKYHRTRKKSEWVWRRRRGEKRRREESQEKRREEKA